MSHIRRLNIELKELEKKYTITELDMKSNIIKLCIFIDEIDLEITFKIDNRYPFSPPHVSFSDSTGLEEWIHTNNTLFLKLLFETHKIKCLCCEMNTTCVKNWNPNISLEVIINDQIRIVKIIRDILSRME